MFMMEEGCTEEDYGEVKHRKFTAETLQLGNSALLLQAGLCLYVFMQAQLTLLTTPTNEIQLNS